MELAIFLGLCALPTLAGFTRSLPRQLTRQQRETRAFLPVMVNSFPNQKRGDGTESPRSFEPARRDTPQWRLPKETD